MSRARSTRKRGSEAGEHDADALDRDREASMADEGGVSAAHVDAQVAPPDSPAPENERAATGGRTVQGTWRR